MPLKIQQEVTRWDVDYRQPNHVYLVSGDKAVAYVPWGKGKPVYFRSFQRIDRRGRKFVEVRKNLWGFDITVEVAGEEQPPGETWEVRGSRGDVYTVSLTDGRWSCTCPGAMFRGSCRHIQSTQASKHTLTNGPA